MSETYDPETGELSTGTNAPALSVSEVSAALKRTIEDAFGFVRVRGEISQPKVATSGHCYLRLKDENANLDAIIWRGTMAKLRGLKPEEGMEVIASGRLTTYPGRSSYQLIIESLELAGAGALLKLLEERRKKLAAEGLFDEARKRPLPVLPTCIGVVTSPTGAVIRDILHRISDRFPMRVLVWPVKVQGEGAAQEVAAAIKGFNAMAADGPVPCPSVLIVARGGGSLEDLWAFNEEIVVRAAAASKIPLIAAVGHETDWTLIDHVADRRAPTPTAAAEMAVPVRLELLARATQCGERLLQAMTRYLEEGRIHLQGLVRGIPRLDEIVEQKTQALDDLAERLKRGPDMLLQRRQQDLAVLGARLNLDRFKLDLTRNAKDIKTFGERAARCAQAILERLDHRIEALAARLESISPKRVLERGYAMVWDASGAPVTVAAGITPGAALQVEFVDGSVGVNVTGASPAKAHKPAKRAKDNPDQGTLL
jgi:exodeoxyribonuclease VII large subunit